jgi:hypothetical protein
MNLTGEWRGEEGIDLADETRKLAIPNGIHSERYYRTTFQYVYVVNPANRLCLAF